MKDTVKHLLTMGSLLILLSSSAIGCAEPAKSIRPEANETTNQTSNISSVQPFPLSHIGQEQAIKIAQTYVDGAYGIKSENAPVNATQALYGNVTIWNVIFTGLPLGPDNGPPDPLGRPFHDVGFGNVTIDANSGAIITAQVYSRRVIDQ